MKITVNTRLKASLMAWYLPQGLAGLVGTGLNKGGGGLEVGLRVSVHGRSGVVGAGGSGSSVIGHDPFALSV